MFKIVITFNVLLVFLQNFHFSNAIEVKTSSGVVKGQTVHFQGKSIDQFLSIPYAEPPIGNLRFAKPEKIKTPRQGIIDGTKFGHSCLQRYVEVIGHLNQSEDCLQLNIWSTYRGVSSGLKPVMFWIHGGGLSIGSIFQVDKVGPWYNGTALASYDVILVAANYRLGPFGFLYGGEESAPGNAGFYDQVMALKWVRENIHLFGGDKDQITIFGESAGSRSVSGLLISPLARGLFNRAIMESGSHIQFKEREVTDKTEALKEAKLLAKTLNCSNAQHWLECLRKAKQQDILDHGSAAAFPLEGTELLPLTSQEAFRQGNFSKGIELIAGVTRNEGSLIGHGQFQSILDRNNLTKKDFIDLVHTTNIWYRNTINEEKVQEFYLKNVNTSDSDSIKIAFYDYYGDLILKCPTYLFAKLFAEYSPKSNVYFYELTYQSKNALIINGCDPKTMGICHVSDMEFVFGVPLLYPNSGDNQTDVEFSKDLMKYWTSFAKFGIPNRFWPTILDKDSNTLMKNMNPFNHFDTFKNNFKATCDEFWKHYYI